MVTRSKQLGFILVVAVYAFFVYLLSSLKLYLEVMVIQDNGALNSYIPHLLNEDQPKTNEKMQTATGVEKLEHKCLPELHFKFPLCNEKFEELRASWMRHCYKSVHGVTGTNCSILQYLSEVMHLCPPMPYRKQRVYSGHNIKINEQSIRLEPVGLLKKLPGDHLRWVRERVLQTWNEWNKAGKLLQREDYMKARSKKKILLYLGSFAYQPWLLEYAGRGGPLGELVQWTDLMASIYVLGHDFDVVVNNTEMMRVLDVKDSNKCIAKVKEGHKDYDIIFTDLNGFLLVGRDLGYHVCDYYRCKLRLLDSFGTEAEHNYKAYSGPIPGGRSEWGGKNFMLSQVMTLFPHSHDNSFLGFVAGSNHIGSIRKENIALVYGKMGNYFKGLRAYLEVAREFFEIHATAVDQYGHIPDFVINHGPVDGNKVKELLRRSKVFLGLGFPYEGPGPLEAAAQGSVYINPKFQEPKNRLNTIFFRNKPTLRKLSSQSPYTEEFIGEPYVFTIDINNETELRRVFEIVRNRKDFATYLPKEFNSFGFTERVHAYLEHQDLCSPVSMWPPLKNRRILLGERAQSCSDTCRRNGLMCENTYFQSINDASTFKRIGTQCANMKFSNWTHAPSYDPQSSICYLQSQILSYSCSSAWNTVARLCPCRDFVKEQVALCSDCL